MFAVECDRGNEPYRRANIDSETSYLAKILRYEQVVGKENEISTPKSRVRVMVIPTNEELLIARAIRGYGRPNTANADYVRRYRRGRLLGIRSANP